MNLIGVFVDSDMWVSSVSRQCAIQNVCMVATAQHLQNARVQLAIRGIIVKEVINKKTKSFQKSLSLSYIQFL